MTLQELLMRNPITKIEGTTLDGQTIYDLLNDNLPRTGQITDLATGEEITAAIYKLPKSTRTKLLKTQVEGGAKGGEIDVHGLLQQLQRQQMGKLNTFIMIVMTVLIAIIICVYCFILYNNSIINHVSPNWTEVTLVLIVPAVIIWQRMGVLSKENQNFVRALAGKLPVTTTIGAIINAWANNSAQNASTANQTQNPTNGTTNRNNRTQSDTDDSVDNPPPGAAR